MDLQEAMAELVAKHGYDACVRALNFAWPDRVLESDEIVPDDGETAPEMSALLHASQAELDRTLVEKERLSRELLQATGNEAARHGPDATGHPQPSSGPKPPYRPKPGGCAFEEANLPEEKTFRPRREFYPAFDHQGERPRHVQPTIAGSADEDDPMHGMPFGD